MKNTNQLKAQKGFFEVEGIEGVFEGVHIGERYSYGVVPYFTMKTCLEIIKHNYDPFYVSYDFDTDKKSFVEIWIEDGKTSSHYASKIELDNITYYNIGNGWSWLSSNIEIELIGETTTISLQVWQHKNKCICVYVDLVDKEIDKIYQFIDGEEVEDINIEQIVTKFINENK